MKFVHAFFYILQKDQKYWCKNNYGKCRYWYHFLYFELEFIFLSGLYSQKEQKNEIKKLFESILYKNKSKNAKILIKLYSKLFW